MRSDSERLADVGVLVVHGMGSQPDESFAAPLIEAIHREMALRGLPARRVAMEPVFWQDVFSGRQQAYLDASASDHRMDWFWLRRWVVSAMGDAAAYRPAPGGQAGAYEAVHGRVRDGIRRLRARIDSDLCPLVVMAHSLGAHVMSNYIWDRQKEGAGRSGSTFEGLHTLTGMITFGCNIPLFALGCEPAIPIKFPPPQLDPAYRPLARWLNLFDPDDVLGYPLRPLGPAFELTVDEDIEIQVGSMGVGATPFSHAGYWSDAALVRPTVDFLEALLAQVHPGG